MQPLKLYLTKDGWRKDLEETVDHIVDSGGSYRRLGNSSWAQMFIGGTLIDQVFYSSHPLPVLGLSAIFLTSGMLHQRAAEKKAESVYTQTNPRVCFTTNYQLIDVCCGEQLNPQWVSEKVHHDTTFYGLN